MVADGQPRPRVLLTAEAANPEWVSIPLEGWSCARALAQVADIHLVTQIRNREAILRARLVEGVDFTAIDSESLARPACRLGELMRGGKGKGWTTVAAISSLTYPYFERLVWRAFKRRIMSGEFQIVHRITPLSPTSPSPLASRCRRIGIPFMLGPLNGGLPWPKHFSQVRWQEREWLSYARSLHKLLPGYRATWRNASAIVAGSVNTWERFAKTFGNKLVYIPENAVDPGRFLQRRTRQASHPVRSVFIGRLVPYKGADMLLEAAAPLLRDGKLKLDIIGDGPQMPQLRQFAHHEGIEAGVTFHGWIEHTQVADHLVESDLLIFPSIREFGGAVVLEAMAVGLVPVVVDYGGPGELATEGTGYLIPLGARPQVVERLRGVLTSIVADPSQIDIKSRAAIWRVERHFTWEAKAALLLQVYRWLLGQSPKPNFPMPIA